MFVVEVTPMRTTPGTGRLSYFSSMEYERGDIITVPIRSKETEAIVMSIAPVSTLKTALRAATFTLRKLPTLPRQGKISASLLSLVDHIAYERALEASDVLTALIPKKHAYIVSRDVESIVMERAHRVKIYIAPHDERMSEYKRIVRESFAAGHSVLFVAPTLEEVSRAKDFLAAGIEAFTITLSGDEKVASQKRTLEVLAKRHPLLIITTPAYAYVERIDIGTVILEHARSKGYRAVGRPYLDHHYAIIAHAKITKRTVIIGDLLPSADNIALLREHVYEEHDALPKRLNLPGKLVVIAQKKDHDGITPFTLFSDELLTTIERVTKKGERMFLLSARRGLAPLVACADCGYIFRDPESGAPLSLHRAVKHAREERWLVSSTSGYKTEMPDICPECNGWRLRERGIGIQHVENELRKALPKIALTLFDHTTATTYAKARRLADSFYANDGQVLLGTTLALSYLARPVDVSGIISMDSLLSLPSWRQQEEAFGTLLALREKTKGNVIVQTRYRTDDRVIALAEHADITSFYDEEIEARRTYSYPPFATFILLSYQGSKDIITKTEDMLKGLFSQHGIAFYGLPATDEQHVLRRGFMRFPRESWPDGQVVRALRSLPPSIRVEFNPERIV